MAGFFPNFNFSPMREPPRVSNVRSSLLGFSSQDTSFFSIVPLVFGNVFNTTNATEIALSQTLQTMWVSVFLWFFPFLWELDSLILLYFSGKLCKESQCTTCPELGSIHPCQRSNRWSRIRRQCWNRQRSTTGQCFVRRSCLWTSWYGTSVNSWAIPLTSEKFAETDASVRIIK